MNSSDYRFLVFGAAHWDVIARATRDTLHKGDDVPGHVTRRMGGVAANIARAVARMGGAPRLVSAVGRDANGEELLSGLKSLRIDLRHMTETDSPTGSYVAIEGADGSLIAAIAQDCPVPDRALREAVQREVLFRGLAIIDGNLSADQVILLTTELSRTDLEPVLVPASPAKCVELQPLITRFSRVYCNLEEARALLGVAVKDTAQAAQNLVETGIEAALVTDGPNAASYCEGKTLISETPAPLASHSGETGAGDQLAAAHLVALSLGNDLASSLSFALDAAKAHLLRING